MIQAANQDVPKRSQKRRPALSGAAIKDDIQRVAPIFLEPKSYAEATVLRAQDMVLVAYILGSETAAELVERRNSVDPSFNVRSVDQAAELLENI